MLVRDAVRLAFQESPLAAVRRVSQRQDWRLLWSQEEADVDPWREKLEAGQERGGRGLGKYIVAKKVGWRARLAEHKSQFCYLLSLGSWQVL